MSTDSRKNRNEEARISNDRIAQYRANLKMAENGPLHVAPEKIAPGMEMRWIRESLLGTPDLYRMSEMAQRYWKPVSAERFPEFVANEKGYASHKGLTLCERPKIYGDIEREQSARENLDIMNTIPGQQHFMSDASMPIQILNNTTMLEQQLNVPSFAE